MVFGCAHRCHTYSTVCREGGKEVVFLAQVGITGCAERCDLSGLTTGNERGEGRKESVVSSSCIVGANAR